MSRPTPKEDQKLNEGAAVSELVGHEPDLSDEGLRQIEHRAFGYTTLEEVRQLAGWDVPFLVGALRDSRAELRELRRAVGLYLAPGRARQIEEVAAARLAELRASEVS